jgi:hypothetical protein
MKEQPAVFAELKQLISEYFDARLSLLKLEAFEKTARVTAALFSSVVVALLAFFLLFFLSLSAGFYLSVVFESNALGFLAVTGFYLLLFALVLFRKKEFLEKFIIDRIIAVLSRKEDEDDQTP